MYPLPASSRWSSRRLKLRQTVERPHPLNGTIWLSSNKLRAYNGALRDDEHHIWIFRPSGAALETLALFRKHISRHMLCVMGILCGNMFQVANQSQEKQRAVWKRTHLVRVLVNVWRLETLAYIFSWTTIARNSWCAYMYI